MNNFTKEELKDIGDALFYGMATLGSRKERLMAIRGKVLEMIESYCEYHCPHEWDGVLITAKPNTGKCRKCDQVCYIAIKDIE